MPKDFLADLAKTVGEAVPERVRNLGAEVNEQIKGRVDGAKGLVNFVRQDEFELQGKILLKTRKKVDDLEKRVAELEALLAKSDLYPKKDEEAKRSEEGDSTTEAL